MVTPDHTMIIAEAGVNHNGDIKIARKLIDCAVETGADVVKFQTFCAEDVVTTEAPKAEYQLRSTEPSQSQLNMLRDLELSHTDQRGLIEYCAESGIKFASTAFDQKSLEFLSVFDLPFYKVPSGEITNLPLIRQLGRLGKPVILSTGASTLQEVELAVYHLNQSGCHDISLLHCTSAYPASMDEVNLRAMVSMSSCLRLPVGYSDHTLGAEVAIAAVALGARIIEKHLTLDRTMAGPDHAASMESAEFAKMVSSIRNVQLALGDGIKRPGISESENIPKIRRSVVAAKAIESGETFSERNTTTKRPAGGRSPMEWDSIMGERATRAYQIDEWID